VAEKTLEKENTAFSFASKGLHFHDIWPPWLGSHAAHHSGENMKEHFFSSKVLVAHTYNPS
jgi:hypothetical protein